MTYPFNIRVYGIFINENNEILLADEERYGMCFTKFPGGGMEFGEGTIECLKRECREELGTEIRVLEHFYTTDFFQLSAFNKKHQIISIYYFAEIINIGDISALTAKKIISREEKVSFRWFPLNELKASVVSFPIDKKVTEMLCMKQG